MSAVKRNARGRKRTSFGFELEESAKEILAHVKGEKTLPTRRIVLPNEADVTRTGQSVRVDH